MAEMDIHLTLDRSLVARASALGPLDGVVTQALRRALDPDTMALHRRWIEDHALLIEAAAGSQEDGTR